MFKTSPGHDRRASFTLLETVVAVGLLATFLLEVGGVQGNAIYFKEYGHNVTKASYLAKRLMSQIEYYWHHYDFKELKVEQTSEVPFEDFKDFTYRIEIRDFKLPLVDLLTGKTGDDKEESGSLAGGISGEMIKEGLNQVLGNELLKTAYVEVFWAEGAKRNSTSLTLLLTNQRKLDEFIGQLKSVVDAINKPQEQPKKPNQPNPNQPNQPNPNQPNPNQPNQPNPEGG